MWQRWMILLLAIAVIAVVQQFWRNAQRTDSTERHGTQNLEFRIENFTLRIFDVNGTEQLRIQSPLLLDKGQNLPSELTAPVVISNSGDDRWQISAERGLLYRSRDEAEFIDNVVVHNLDKSDSARLQTSYLRLMLKNKTIHSPELVTIIKPGLQLQGIGLLGDINTARYYLQNEIQATYVDQ